MALKTSHAVANFSPILNSLQPLRGLNSIRDHICTNRSERRMVIQKGGNLTVVTLLPDPTHFNYMCITVHWLIRTCGLIFQNYIPPLHNNIV